MYPGKSPVVDKFAPRQIGLRCVFFRSVEVENRVTVGKFYVEAEVLS